MTTAAEKTPRRASTAPDTSTEEMPLLSETERVEMIASLEAARAEYAAGHFVEHESSTFVDRMMALREAAIRSKKV